MCECVWGDRDVWTAYVLQDVYAWIHTYISHSMYLTMRVCVCVHVWQDIQHAHTHMIFRVCPLMQLATNYERRMKVFCFASISSSGRQRERERYSERWQKTHTHIRLTYAHTLSHTHIHTASKVSLWLLPTLSFSFPSFARFGFFLSAFFCAFCLCFLSLFLSLRRRRLTRFFYAPPPLSLSSLVWPPSRQI